MSKKNEKKKKVKPELDTETTFVDMNVDGFRWYDPSRKGDHNPKQNRVRLTKKEYRSMVKGAFAALWPYMVCTVIAFAIMVCLAYLWLL